MGNRRSVEKALEHVGARASISSDPARLRAAAGLVVPGRGRVPARDGEPARARPRRAAARARRRAARRCSASAWACSWRSSPRPSWAAPTGLGHRPRRGARAARRVAEAAAHRLERGALRQTAARRCSRSCRASAPSTTCTRSRPCRPRERGRARHRRVRRAVRQRRRAAARSTACSSTPRSPPRRGCACSPTSRASARAARASPARRGEALPGDRHPRRQRRAAGQGRLRRQEGLRRGPAVGGARLGRGGRRATCTSSTSTAPKRASRSTSSTCGAIAGELGLPVQYGGGLRSARGGRRRARRAGAHAGDPRHRRVHRPGAAARGAGRARARARARVGRRARRAASRRAGWTQTHRRCTPRGVLERCTSAACASFVYTNVDRDGMLDGPDLEEVARGRAAAARGQLIYSGGIGALADLEALAALRRRTSLERRDRRQGALRGALHDRARRRPALAG